MRRIVLIGLALICVIIIGSMGATREPRSAVIEAAPTQNPQPVAVTNFPTVQGVTGTVNVGNLPAVQNVMGTVAVANLPAVQAVAGTVAVGNLPLDPNGNVRVTSGPPSPPPSAVIKIADALPVGPVESLTLGPINVAGWHRISLIVRANIAVNGDTSCIHVSAPFSLDGIVLVNGPMIAVCTDFNTSVTSETRSDIAAQDLITPEVTVFVTGANTPSTLDAWLYLSN
jgi:hypothetical protein